MGRINTTKTNEVSKTDIEVIDVFLSPNTQELRENAAAELSKRLPNLADSALIALFTNMNQQYTDLCKALLSNKA